MIHGAGKLETERIKAGKETAKEILLTESLPDSGLADLDFRVYAKPYTTYIAGADISSYIPSIASSKYVGERIGLKTYTTVLELTAQNVRLSVQAAQSGMSLPAFCKYLEMHEVYARVATRSSRPYAIDIFTGELPEAAVLDAPVSGSVRKYNGLPNGSENLLAIYLLFSEQKYTKEQLKDEVKKTGFVDTSIHGTEFTQKIFTAMIRAWGAEYAQGVFDALSLTPAQQSEYYRAIGNYATVFALAGTANARKRTGTIYPYPAGIEEGFPDVIALPSILQSVWDFMKGIERNGLTIGETSEFAKQIILLLEGLSADQAYGVPRKSLLARVCGDDATLYNAILPVWNSIGKEIKTLAKSLINSPAYRGQNRDARIDTIDYTFTAVSEFEQRFNELGLKHLKKKPHAARTKFLLSTED